MSEQRLLFEGIPQRDIMIRQYPSKSPVFYQAINMMQAVVTVDLKAAKTLLPSQRLSPLAASPGRAIMGINCFEYLKTDVGPYNEVSLAIAVQVDKHTPSLWAAISSALKRAYHAYIFELPVNTEIALYGGLDYFNYPKFMTQIEFTEDEQQRKCSVLDYNTGELIYAFKGDKLETRINGQDVSSRDHMDLISFYGYPIMNDHLMRAHFELNPIERGSRWLGNAFEIELGYHERAALLAQLNPGRMLQYTYLPKGEGVLYEPEMLEHNPSRSER